MTAAAFLLQAASNATGLTPDQQFQLAQEALSRHNSNGLAGIIGAFMVFAVPISGFAMSAVIVWLSLKHRHAQTQARTELRKQVVDKFSSGQELSQFLESEAGRQFLSIGSEPRKEGPRGWRGGIILTTVGLAFLGLAAAGHHRLIVVGVLFLAVGLGLLISAYVAHRMQSSGNPSAASGGGASHAGLPGSV